MHPDLQLRQLNTVSEEKKHRVSSLQSQTLLLATPFPPRDKEFNWKRQQMAEGVPFPEARTQRQGPRSHSQKLRPAFRKRKCHAPVALGADTEQARSFLETAGLAGRRSLTWKGCTHQRSGTEGEKTRLPRGQVEAQTRSGFL